MGSTNKQIQVKFHTKQQRFALPNLPFSIPTTVNVLELNNLIKTLLNEHTEIEQCNVEFDFIIGNEFLRIPLGQHLENKNVSTETCIDIEYVEKCTAPSPEENLLHDDWVSAVHANENWILTGCYDNTLHIWSVTGEHKLTIPGHTQQVKAVSWLEGSKEDLYSFVSASFDQTAIIWEWSPQSNCVECIYICRGHAGTVVCVSAHDNKFATGSWDKMIKIWSSLPDESADVDRKRVKTEGGTHSKIRTPLMTLSGHKDQVSAVEWVNAGELCSASWDHTIRLWDVEMGGLKSQLVGTKNFNDISYSPFNKLIVSGSTDRHVRLWDTRQRDAAVVKNVYSSHNGWITCVHWAPNDTNQFISGSFDSVLKLWDMRSCKVPLYDMLGHKDKILCCNWSNPKCILSGGCDNQLKIFKSGGSN